ncbi:hypothetical protein C7S15_2959 [Burkholderia cepacia]|nr:hypothetical protein [Burkholderia cepacia]
MGVSPAIARDTFARGTMKVRAGTARAHHDAPHAQTRSRRADDAATGSAARNGRGKGR